MNHSLRMAGGTLIVSSLGFIAVFNYLATHFGYPDVLDGAADSVLPALVNAGPELRWVWALYAVLPLGIALAALWAYPLFRRTGETTARFGLMAALFATFAMTAGLMRWPTINYVLGRAFVQASMEQRQVLAAVFDAGNVYLGTVTGELMGELGLSLWFVTLSVSIVRGAGSVGIARWVGYLGMLMGVSMSVGACRNVSSLVAPLAEANNLLLPVWLIVLGGALLRCEESGSATAAARARQVGVRAKK